MTAPTLVTRLGERVAAGRVMPNNVDAEQALLGAILLNNKAYSHVADFLEPEHFFQDLHGQIYETAASLIKGGKSATPITLKTFLKDVDLGGVTVSQYLARLTAEAVTVNGAADYGRIIHDLAVRRQLVAIGDNLVSAAYDSPVDASPADQIAEAERQLEELNTASTARATCRVDIFKWASTRFLGEPPPVKRLIDNSIPLGVPTTVAAMGEVGKSFLTLDLGHRTAFGQKPGAAPIFGGHVVHEGTAVILTAEDSLATVHRRLAALDPLGAKFAEGGERLIVVPLPEVGGPKPYFVETREGYRKTDDWRRLFDQLVSITDLALVVIDPLQAFCHVRINEDPGAGQFVSSELAHLAAVTGASVITPHHMRKARNERPISSPAEAREAIRGTTALIDGVRLAYALWPVDDAAAREVCAELATRYEPNRVVRGAVVKANEYAKRTVSTYVRNESGLLVDASDRLVRSAPDTFLLDDLVDAIRRAALNGKPFTKTGKSGLYEQRSRLPIALGELARNKLEDLAENALRDGVTVKAVVPPSKIAQWLDVPDGPFARGDGSFTAGAAS